MYLKEIMNRELVCINKLIDETETLLKNYSDLEEGSLVLEIKKLHNLYYYFQKKGDVHRKYLGPPSDHLVDRYKEKRFYQEKLKILVHDKKVIEHALKALMDFSSEVIHDNLPEAYKNLPGFCYDDALHKELAFWAKQQYERNPYPIPSDPNIACDGTKTRSKGETIIYDNLFHEDIPFRFDPKLRMKGASGVMRSLFPDFVFKCFDGRLILWEHLGMMEKDKYAARLTEKIEEYMDCGFILGDNLIITSDTIGNSTNELMIIDMVEFVKNKVFGPDYDK